MKRKSLTPGRTWLPLVSRKKAMAEIAQAMKENRQLREQNESARAAQAMRHREEELRFRDIIDRLQGHIDPDGNQVMLAVHRQLADGHHNIPLDAVRVEMDHRSSTLIFYARVTEYLLGRMATLTPQDIRLVAEHAGQMIASEIARQVMSGKMEFRH